MTTTRLIILLLVLNLLVVSSGVVVNYLMLRPLAQAAAWAESERAEPPVVQREYDVVQREYEFYPVEKVIVSLREGGRERYFVLDLALLVEAGERSEQLKKAEPLVRSSVVSYLSTYRFEELRALPVSELQHRLEQALFADFVERKAQAPFLQVLVSKLIVQ